MLSASCFVSCESVKQPVEIMIDNEVVQIDCLYKQSNRMLGCGYEAVSSVDFYQKCFGRLPDSASGVVLQSDGSLVLQLRLETASLVNYDREGQPNKTSTSSGSR